VTPHPCSLAIAAMLCLSAAPAGAQTKAAGAVAKPAPTQTIIIVGGRTARGGKVRRRAGIAALNPQPLPPEPRPAVAAPATPQP